MDRNISFNISVVNGKNRFLHIYLNEKFIGYCSLTCDEKPRFHEGVLILQKVIQGRELYILVKSIQEKFLYLEEELFLEVFYGIYKGLMCDETPKIWDKIIG
ncbi:MAG: hypothetical protein ACRC6U_07520 [Fusobacteriaceae bacterium]